MFLSQNWTFTACCWRERPVRSPDAVATFLRRLEGQAELLDAIAAYLVIEEKLTLGFLVNNEKLRAAIDGGMRLDEARKEFRYHQLQSREK